MQELQDGLQRDLFNEFLSICQRHGEADELRYVGQRVLALDEVVQSIKAAAGELTSGNP